MKKAKKVIVLFLCAILLMAVSVMGTLAYLTSRVSVQNTFTAGNVTITMVESDVDEYGANPNGTTNANEYKLIPGHEYIKDPTIKVGAGSEDCYIFVEIVNGLGANATIPMNAGWTKLAGDINGTSVWTCGIKSKNDDAVKPFEKFTFAANADPSAYATATNASAKITVTAYAIQADTMVDAADAWAKLTAQLNPPVNP